MKKNKAQRRMNLTMDVDFYDLLEENAKNEYLMVSSYVKRLLKKSLLTNNNSKSKRLIKNETNM